MQDRQQIKVIGRKADTSLVEWREEGKLFRAFVPSDQIIEENGSQFYDHPEQGIPYGLPWALIVQREIDAEALETELYKRGIWTYEDFQKNPQIITSSLQKVLRLTMVQLRLNILDFQGE